MAVMMAGSASTSVGNGGNQAFCQSCDQLQRGFEQERDIFQKGLYYGGDHLHDCRDQLRQCFSNARTPRVATIWIAASTSAGRF